MRKIFALLIFVNTSLCGKVEAQQKDPFLTNLYDHLHDSPLQNKYKLLKPMPVGVVYVQRPNEGEKEMRQHFKLMKTLGFNCLKQIMTCPGWSIEQVSLIALEEGIIPWWYDTAGWEPVSDTLLAKLDLPLNLSIQQIEKDPRMIAYQNEVMKNRILKIQDHLKIMPEDSKTFLSGRSVAFDPEVGVRGFLLTDTGKILFNKWVKARYKNIEELNHAWNQYHSDLQASGKTDAFLSWDDFDRNWEKLRNNEYRHLCDILEFKAEHSLERIRIRAEQFKEFDGNTAFRGGGELGLFLPQAWYGVDLERIANLIKDYGSFYPSIHFAWHFGEVNYELLRPFYMQAALANDYMKGGWVGAWEATGGPQQFSGGKGGDGFTVDDKVMTQFIMSQIAAGFKGFGLWCWSSRSAGWEAGEYALLDRNNQVTPRAVQVGKIAKAMRTYKSELWDAHKEPLVGVLTDWNNEAVWAAMSQTGRDEFRDAPIKARIGVSRALINANIPYEYVTVRDVNAGLAMRYKVIYLPAILSISKNLLLKLTTYVNQGGRLVMDLPSAWYDENGALLITGKGSDFEKLFGATLNDFQYSGVNREYKIKGLAINGFTADIGPTVAKTIAAYDNGKTAITENHLGKGTAVLLGYEASTVCFKPGNAAMEQLLVKNTLLNYTSPYSCPGAIVYRLSSAAADHYFIMNEGPSKKIALKTIFSYGQAKDAITGEKVLLTGPVEMQANSARWVRVEKITDRKQLKSNKEAHITKPTF